MCDHVTPANAGQASATGAIRGESQLKTFIGTAFVMGMAAALLAAAQPAAGAGNYPYKSIRLVVPSAPGGGTDILSRWIGQGLL